MTGAEIVVGLAVDRVVAPLIAEALQTARDLMQDDGKELYISEEFNFGTRTLQQADNSAIERAALLRKATSHFTMSAEKTSGYQKAASLRSLAACQHAQNDMPNYKASLQEILTIRPSAGLVYLTTSAIQLAIKAARDATLSLPTNIVALIREPNPTNVYASVIDWLSPKARDELYRQWLENATQLSPYDRRLVKLHVEISSMLDEKIVWVVQQEQSVNLTPRGSST